MSKQLKEKLDEEINARLDAFDQIPVGTQEDKEAVDAFEKLWKLKAESEGKSWKEWAELGLKALGIAVDIGGIAGPLLFYNLWMKRGFQFEQEGTFTSTTFRWMQNSFPKMRKK